MLSVTSQISLVQKQATEHTCILQQGLVQKLQLMATKIALNWETAQRLSTAAWPSDFPSSETSSLLKLLYSPLDPDCYLSTTLLRYSSSNWS